MKQSKALDFFEQLNLNEMAQVKGGASLIERPENQTDTSPQIIYINGRPYLIEKDGSIRPV